VDETITEITDEHISTIIDAEGGEQPLTLSDRCDRCGAQAFVRVYIGESDLLFCGHHYNRYEANLIGCSTGIQDERFRINEKPSVSANAD
jgi:hypothetical protein